MALTQIHAFLHPNTFYFRLEFVLERSFFLLVSSFPISRLSRPVSKPALVCNLACSRDVNFNSREYGLEITRHGPGDLTITEGASLFFPIMGAEHNPLTSAVSDTDLRFQINVSRLGVTERDLMSRYRQVIKIRYSTASIGGCRAPLGNILILASRNKPKVPRSWRHMIQPCAIG